jgi:hypothetical protein
MDWIGKEAMTTDKEHKKHDINIVAIAQIFFNFVVARFTL